MKIFLGLWCLIFAGSVNAGLIQVTADSAVSGELGWFIVDDSIFETDTRIEASQFYDFSWLDPINGISINPEDITSDTGATHFSYIDDVWTVTGSSGTALESALWIASDYYIWFVGGNDYSDVNWTTTAYLVSVSEPGTFALLGLGLAGLVLSRKKKTS